MAKATTLPQAPETFTFLLRDTDYALVKAFVQWRNKAPNVQQHRHSKVCVDNATGSMSDGATEILREELWMFKENYPHLDVKQTLVEDAFYENRKLYVLKSEGKTKQLVQLVPTSKHWNVTSYADGTYEFLED